MRNLSTWLKKHLKLQLDQYYLIPNLVHLWSVDFRYLKLNILKSLIYINCLNPDFPSSAGNNQITNPTVINQITNLLEGTFSEQDVALNPVRSSADFNIFNNKKSPCYNFICTLNNNSSLFLLLKMLQLCFNMLVATNEIVSKINDENLSLENLIVDALLAEIQATNTANYWCIDSTFDRIWSCLLRIRYSMLTCHLLDPLNLTCNVLPSVIHKHISFYRNRDQNVYSLAHGSRSKVILNGEIKLAKQDPLLKAFELMMKSMFGTILTEDENIYMFMPKNEVDNQSIDVNYSYLNRLTKSSSSSFKSESGITTSFRFKSNNLVGFTYSIRED